MAQICPCDMCAAGIPGPDRGAHYFIHTRMATMDRSNDKNVHHNFCFA